MTSDPQFGKQNKDGRSGSDTFSRGRFRLHTVLKLTEVEQRKSGGETYKIYFSQSKLEETSLQTTTHIHDTRIGTPTLQISIITKLGTVTSSASLLNHETHYGRENN